MNFDEIVGKLNAYVNSTSFRLQMGYIARDIIYKRVKSGYGVSNDISPSPTKTKLAPLSDSYKLFRRGLVGFYTDKMGRVRRMPRTTNFIPATPRLGPDASPTRSNLTLTGQMLNSIAVRTRNNGTELYIQNNIRSGVTRYDRSIKTNSEVANYVSRKRPFFALTDGEQLIMQRELYVLINAQLQRLLK